MLENVVETERGKVKELEKDIQNKRTCEKCENVPKCIAEFNFPKAELPKDVPSTSKCGSCDFESENANDVNTHSNIKHAFVCEECDVIFKNKVKLQTHMCRIIVRNPTWGDYYMKNWVIAKTCARIFSSSDKKEVLFLHAQECIDLTNSCQDLDSDYDLPNYYGDTSHAPLKDYFSNGLINWELLHGQFETSIK